MNILKLLVLCISALLFSFPTSAQENFSSQHLYLLCKVAANNLDQNSNQNLASSMCFSLINGVIIGYIDGEYAAYTDLREKLISNGGFDGKLKAEVNLALTKLQAERSSNFNVKYCGSPPPEVATQLIQLVEAEPDNIISKTPSQLIMQAYFVSCKG